MDILEYFLDCRSYGSGTPVSGKLIIFDDKIVFEPASSMKIITFGKTIPGLTIYLKDIVKCEKKLLGFWRIYISEKDYYVFNSFKKSEIISAIEERKAKLSDK